MRPHLAFLHTSPVHIDTFARLLGRADAELVVEHFVAEDLLVDAQRLGTDHPALVERVHAAMSNAAAQGAALVVCTCSTIGQVAERMPTAGRFTAARIDRAMADRAVRLGSNVLVVAALESTLGPTTELIRESAQALNADVVLQTLWVEDAWPRFLRGDQAGYVQAVVHAVRAAAGQADVIVLAQASMAPAVVHLQGLGVEVLASPALGVEAIKAYFAA